MLKRTTKTVAAVFSTMCLLAATGYASAQESVSCAKNEQKVYVGYLVPKLEVYTAREGGDRYTNERSVTRTNNWVSPLSRILCINKSIFNTEAAIHQMEAQIARGSLQVSPATIVSVIPLK